MKTIKFGLAALLLGVAIAGCKKNEPERLPGPQANAAATAVAVGLPHS